MRCLSFEKSCPCHISCSECVGASHRKRVGASDFECVGGACDAATATTACNLRNRAARRPPVRSGRGRAAELPIAALTSLAVGGGSVQTWVYDQKIQQLQTNAAVLHFGVVSNGDGSQMFATPRCIFGR